MRILSKETEEPKESISKKWKAVYKCRNCGKLFYIPCTLIDNFPIPTNTTIWAHMCEKVVYGYGDLQSSITYDQDMDEWNGRLGSKSLEK